MLQGLLGKKLGMTQVYGEGGRVAPVTVIRAGPCTVLQVKKPDTDGYAAIQLGFDDRKPKNVPRPLLGHIAKATLGPSAGAQGAKDEAAAKPGDAKPEAGSKSDAAKEKKPRPDFSKVVGKRFIREIGWDGKDEVAAGQQVTVESLTGAAYVDVTGWSKGRGFAGVVKRHGFSGGPRTHGQSDRERAPGAVGRAHSISKGVMPGKRMAGHYGTERVTVKNLEVVTVDKDHHLLLVRGAVPGPNDGYLLIRRSRKVKRERKVVEGKKKGAAVKKK